MLGKLNRYLAKVSVFLISAALIAGMAGCDGYDHPSRNLEIRDWYDLDAVRYNLDGDHILMNDLDSTTPGYTTRASPTAHGGKGWESIGYMDRFTGSFDGQGYEIRDLFINRPDEAYLGLFGRVDDTGVIKDVGVANAAVTGWRSVGGLAGENQGTVIDCYATGTVIGDERVGGLIGRTSGTVIDCYSTSTVIGNGCVGGLVGNNYEGTVGNSYYNYDEALINGENIITIGALFGEDFDQWLANDKFLDVNDRLPQEGSYYVINNVTDFKELLAFGQNATLKFRLKNDLDLGSEPNFYIPYLAGEFDGNGHKVSNLSFNFDFVSYVGLFGYLASGLFGYPAYGGKVTQVAAENVNITAHGDVGGLVGYSHGTLSNSHSSGSVNGECDVGGLVGRNYGAVSNCSATCSVTGRFTRAEIGGEDNAGGLVGLNKGTVSDSYSTGSVSGNHDVGGLVGFNCAGVVYNSNSAGSVTGREHVGGLVGFNFGIVYNSYFTGNATGCMDVGGLVGDHLSGTVHNSHSIGNVTGEVFPSGLFGWHVGGLIGSHHDGIVSGCYFIGTVIGTEYVGGLVAWTMAYCTVDSSYSAGTVTGVEWVGGLVGDNSAAMRNCYSTSTVSGVDCVGGLVAWNNDGTVSNSYSTGSVSGNSDVGGLVGKNSDTVSNSFWDTETSGQSTSDGGTGKNTTEMQDTATFSGAGWDIIAVALNETNSTCIWNIVHNETYPFLSWET